MVAAWSGPGVSFADADSVRRLAAAGVVVAWPATRRCQSVRRRASCRTVPGCMRCWHRSRVSGPICACGPFGTGRSTWLNWSPADDWPAARLVSAVVRARLAYLITGGTGAGKTTMLSSLLGLVPPQRRDRPGRGRRRTTSVSSTRGRPAGPLLNVEERARSRCGIWSARPCGCAPDRLIVGGVSRAEIVDLLGALNTGHEGGAGALHANTAADVPARLEGLDCSAGCRGWRCTPRSWRTAGGVAWPGRRAGAEPG